MELDPENLIDNNIIVLQSLKESIRKNKLIKESTNTFVLTKAVLEALKIFDANNTCMTVQECADFLKCHRNTITNRIHNKKIKALFIGRVWRIPKLQFVDEILDKNIIE